MSGTIVDVILVVVIAGLLGWDYKLWRDGKQGNTISERARVQGFNYTVIPAYVGMLCMHWFHPFSNAYAASVSGWLALTWIVVLGIAAAIADFMTASKPRWWLFLWFIVGGIGGGFLWPV